MYTVNKTPRHTIYTLQIQRYIQILFKIIYRNGRICHYIHSIHIDIDMVCAKISAAKKTERILCKSDKPNQNGRRKINRALYVPQYQLPTRPR